MVVFVVQGDEPVRQPGNGVGLARPGAVLDQVILTRPVLPCVLCKVAVVPACGVYGASQSSRNRPTTRLNSWVLCVTSVTLLARAMAAIW
jgi:hypothetical protein